jgi:PPM family protein phosphatase
VQVHTAAATHVGQVRRVNEDSFLVLPHLALVADGMGGHASGDVASALATAVFAELGELEQLHSSDIVATVERANTRILDEAREHRERSGMGTTITGIAQVVDGGAPHWLVFNVGDSRVYRLTDDAAVQITHDHSEVASMVAAGRLTPELARTHPLRNVITRSLGITPAPEADTWMLPVEPGDLFLICSDGLTGELEDAEIHAIVDTAHDLSGAAEALVTAAVMHGGRDNVTVVLVAVTDVEARSADTVEMEVSP